MILPRAAFMPAHMAADCAAIEREAQAANARVRRGEFLEHLPRVVLAAIVGDDDFVGAIERCDGIGDGFDQRAQIVLLVVAGNDKGKFRRFGHMRAAKDSQILAEASSRIQARAQNRMETSIPPPASSL